MRGHNRATRELRAGWLRLLKTHILLGIKRRPKWFLHGPARHPGHSQQATNGEEKPSEEPSTDTRKPRAFLPRLPPTRLPLAEVTEGVCEPPTAEHFILLRRGHARQGGRVLEQTSRVLSTWKWQAVFKVGAVLRDGEVPPHHFLSPAFLPCFWHRSRPLGKQVQKNNAGLDFKNRCQSYCRKEGNTVHFDRPHLKHIPVK